MSGSGTRPLFLFEKVKTKTKFGPEKLDARRRLGARDRKRETRQKLVQTSITKEL